ncbi:MAG: potassium-transporting ATPase subunit KdpC [Leptospiraceae bacterium]|nr:potassium-transporting ATPase subunit KdpC [Leptospiraceae bacterium]
MKTIRLFITLTIFTGVLYPLLVTAVASLFFKDKSRGSLVYLDGKLVGSSLLGQEFKSEKYFHSRPSAGAYNAYPSGASNQSMTNKDLRNTIKERKEKLKEFNPVENNNYPQDLLFASGSGLDPHISPESAKFQIPRIAKVRNFSSEQIINLEKLVEQKIEHRDYRILGEERVNVLLLNLALDAIR